MSISKELLCEVYEYDDGREIFDICLEDNDVKFSYSHKDFGEDEEVINIHELAHKCKEWAIKDDYFIDSSINGVCAMAIISTKEGQVGRNHIMDSEPEAIFKACQWIKDNKC